MTELNQSDAAKRHAVLRQERITLVTVATVLAIAVTVVVLSRGQLLAFLLILAATIPWVLLYTRLRSWRALPLVVAVVVSLGFAIGAGYAYVATTEAASATATSSASSPSVPLPPSGGDSPSSGTCHAPTVTATIVGSSLTIDGGCWVPGTVQVNILIDGGLEDTSPHVAANGTIHFIYQLKSDQLSKGTHRIQAEDGAHDGHTTTTYTIP